MPISPTNSSRELAPQSTPSPTTTSETSSSNSSPVPSGALDRIPVSRLPSHLRQRIISETRGAASFAESTQGRANLPIQRPVAAPPARRGIVQVPVIGRPSSPASVADVHLF